MATYHFHDAVHKYRSIGRNLRKPRAELIFQKYLRESRTGRRSVFVSSGALPPPQPQPQPQGVGSGLADGMRALKLDESIVQKINEELILSDSNAALTNLFDEAQAVARTRLDAAFVVFLTSAFFADYRNALTLPADIRAAVDAEQKE